MQVRFKHNIDSRISGAVSFEKSAAFKLNTKYKGFKPSDKLPQTNKVPLNHIPAVALSLRCNYPESLTLKYIRLGCLGRLLQCYDTQDKDTATLPAGGVTLGAKFRFFSEQNIVKLQVVLGRGIGKYVAGLSGIGEGTNEVYVLCEKTKDQGNTSLHYIDVLGAYLALE